MITLSHVSKAFNDQIVLDDISLEIKTSEILVVMGASGVGKSVLLKSLIGLIKPDQGEIFIDSVDITKLRERELLKMRKKIGYLFQEGALYDFMNVHQNLAFPLKEHTTFSAKTIAQKVHDVLKFVDLKNVNEKFPSELSGGMKKRVGLARSIILDCKILFCDEPTSGLDPIRSRDISDLIRSVSKKMNCTTVITSHDVENSMRIADRLALLHKGKIVALGTKKDLEVSQDPYVRKFLMKEELIA